MTEWKSMCKQTVRAVVCSAHVVVRVTADAVLELHIDMEEANGVGLRNGDTVRGIKQAARHG